MAAISGHSEAMHASLAYNPPAAQSGPHISGSHRPPYTPLSPPIRPLPCPLPLPPPPAPELLGPVREAASDGRPLTLSASPPGTELFGGVCVFSILGYLRPAPAPAAAPPCPSRH